MLSVSGLSANQYTAGGLILCNRKLLRNSYYTKSSVGCALRAQGTWLLRNRAPARRVRKRTRFCTKLYIKEKADMYEKDFICDDD